MAAAVPSERYRAEAMTWSPERALVRPGSAWQAVETRDSGCKRRIERGHTLVSDLMAGVHPRFWG
jgi:hypothetical protein